MFRLTVVLLATLLTACQQPAPLTRQDLQPIPPGQQALNIPAFIPPSNTISVSRAVSADYLVVEETRFGRGAWLVVQSTQPNRRLNPASIEEVTTPEAFLASRAGRLPDTVDRTPVEIVPVRHERTASVGYLMRFPRRAGGFCSLGRAFYTMRAPSFVGPDAIHDTLIESFACHEEPAIPEAVRRVFFAAEPMREEDRAGFDAMPVRGPLPAAGAAAP